MARHLGTDAQITINWTPMHRDLLSWYLHIISTVQPLTQIKQQVITRKTQKSGAKHTRIMSVPVSTKCYRIMLIECQYYYINISVTFCAYWESDQWFTSIWNRKSTSALNSCNMPISRFGEKYISWAFWHLIRIYTD